MPTKIVYTPNYTVVGSPTISDDYVVSGFSSSNYVKIPSSFPSSFTSADLIFKVNLTSTSSNSVILCRSTTSEQYYGIRANNRTFSIYNSGWTDGTNALDLNTWYWCRVQYDGITWKGYTLEDNNYTLETLPAISDWRQEWSTSTGWISSTSCDIGHNFATSAEYFHGEIDLFNYSISLDDTNWWEAVTVTEIDVSGSINISKGYYDSGSAKIIMPASTVSLTDLKSGETVGCKNKLFAYSKNNVAGAKITGNANEDITTAHDVSVDLNKPIYLDHTKEYIAGGAEIAPALSFSNGGYIANYTVNGSPTISSEYVASGFSSSNYLTTPSSIDLTSASTWEFITKVTVGSTSYDQKIILGAGLNFGITNSGYLHIWLRSTSSWFVDENIVSGSSVNDKYLKIEYTGSVYNFYSSDDGSTWTLLKTINNSTKVGVVSTIDIGNSGSEYWRGSIDLSKTSLSADGVVVWKALLTVTPGITTQKALVYDSTNDKTFWYPSETSEQLSDFLAKADKNDLFLTNKTGQPSSDIVVSGNGTTYVKNFTEVGTPTISNDFAVSDFTAGAIGIRKFVKTSVTLDPSLPWELNCKFTTGAINTSANNTVVGREGNYVSPTILIVGSTRKIYLMLSVNGTSYFYVTSEENAISDNTTYWARGEFTGSAYNLYLSTDGINYTLLKSTSSNKVMTVSTPMTLCFGARYGNDLTSVVEPLKNSTIYMKDCNLKSNGTVIWTGAEGYIADSSMKDEKSVWLNHAHDKILGVQEEPDEIVLEGGPWTQPILSSNGTWGGTEFAVSASSVLSSDSEPWKAFDGIPDTNSNDRWHSSSGHPSWIGWYNPEPLIITNIQVQNRAVDGSFINSYDVSYSDDGSTWTVCTSGTSPDQTDGAYWNIAISETTGHKYWKLISNSSSGSNSDYTAVGLITLTAHTDTVQVSDSHYWTYLKDSTYDCEGKSLAVSSMSGSALSGSLLAMQSGTLVYTENNYQGVLGDAFTGYTVTFTDTSHSAIASLTKTGTRCRCYSAYNGNVENPHYYSFYVTSLPVTGEIPMSMVGLIGEREITPSSSTSSYTYDSTTDTITYSGFTASYIGDVYVNLGA